MTHPALTEAITFWSGLVEFEWFISPDGKSAVGFIRSGEPETDVIALDVDDDGTVRSNNAHLGEWSTGGPEI